jgi:hypothetical protein
MARSIVIILLVALYIWQSNAQLSKSYKNCKIMSGLHRYHFHWTLTATHIEVAVQAPTNGWIALGLVAPGVTQNEMISNGAGTDAAIGYFRADDPYYPRGYLRDAWITERHNPPADPIQNLDLISASRENGVLTLEWRRPLVTNDTLNDRAIDVSKTISINWAFNNDTGAVTVNDPEDIIFTRHPPTTRGTVQINLSEASTCDATPQAETRTFYTNNDGTFYAEWTTNDEEINVSFRGKTRTGWVAFAFDADGLMPDHDSYIGWIDSAGNVNLTDRYASSRDDPITDVTLGGNNDIIKYTGAVVQVDGATWLQFNFTRKLDTGDKYDLVLAPGRPGYLLWAIGPNNGVNYATGKLTTHMSKGSVQIDFFGGCISNGTVTDWRKLHAILMVIAWCALLFTGSFFARYLKVLTTAWFKIHVALQTVGVAMVLAGFIIIFVFLGQFTMGAHQVIGLVIFGLTMLQPFLGLIADRLFDPSRSKAPAQDQIHWWVGRFLLVLAVVNIFLGIDELFPISNGAYILYGLFAGWTALSVAILIAQEIRVGGAEESDVISLTGSSAVLIDNEDNKKKSGIAKKSFIVWMVLQAAILVVFLVFVGILPADGSLTAPTSTCK